MNRLSTLIIIPAYQSERHLGAVLTELQKSIHLRAPLGLLVVDDGSTDLTHAVARAAGAEVVRHTENRGKGAALCTGLAWAEKRAYTQAVTADADGQHPVEEILRLVDIRAPENALVLGIRDLLRDGAPRANRFSNAISNYFISLFTGERLRDTECGLRRYPVRETLALKCKDASYAFEAEVLLRAARNGLPILQVPIRVHYPDAANRLSHFHVVRDPLRIVRRVLLTVVE